MAGHCLPQSHAALCAIQVANDSQFTDACQQELMGWCLPSRDVVLIAWVTAFRVLPPQIPFVKAAPMVTFRKPIGSVSVSGHKFVGAPVPCGVLMTRKRYAAALSSDIEYLNSRDATIMVRTGTWVPLATSRV